MKVLLCPLLLGTVALHAQFQFTGRASKEHANGEVYLSLVTDYRKSSRVYLDQIFQKTTADSLGRFSFTGDNLPSANNMYRIHVDGCDGGPKSKRHFLGECAHTESVRFIARNTDTLHLPLDNFGQAFCEMASTNPKSGLLLEVDALKDEMIVDVVRQETDLARGLTFTKWFGKLQAFGMRSGEPLVELYIHDFLSDRKSEAHPYYLEELKNSGYYDGLAERLADARPEAAMTGQFLRELHADKTLLAANGMAPSGIKPEHALYAFGFLAIVLSASYALLRRKKASKATLRELLTKQEQRIMDAMLNEKSNKEIAAAHHISLSTVKTHINSIYKKLDVASRSELRAKF